MFFDKRVFSVMSRTAITSKFKMRWFPNDQDAIELQSCKQV